MAGLASIAYNAIFKRTSTFLVAAVTTAFLFERSVDVLTNTIFDNYNRGKQWKDIKQQLEK